MPDSPPDPSRLPAKSALPAHRSGGEKPRAFADQAADPIGLPTDDFPLKPAPPERRSRGNKSSLPSGRNKERVLPTFTPAPYQSETPPTLSPARRAELPGPRKADEHPKFRPPQPVPEPEPPADPFTTPSLDANPIPSEAAPQPPAPRPTKHRLADNRVLELKRQGTVEGDPELTESWGGDENEAPADRQRSRRLALWSALIGLPLIALAVWQSLGRPGSAAPDPPSPVPPKAGASVNAAEETRRAADVIKRFLATATLEERAAFVRHPEITKTRMETWHSPANPLKPRKVVDFRDRSSEQTINDVTFLMLNMVLDDHLPRSIAVEKTKDGGYLVDWESFVFWSDPRWPEFLSKEPEGTSDFRVVVSIDTYFNYGYADAKKWFCYKLSDPENWAHCWGYCSIDSDAGMQINRMIRRQRQQGENQIKAILKLRFEEGGRGHNQVLIEEVVEDGWIKIGS
ncbi:MAG: hypothetical protein ACKV19_12915 [Verrucomicrobiales bacterium]